MNLQKCGPHIQRSSCRRKLLPVVGVARIPPHIAVRVVCTHSLAAHLVLDALAAALVDGCGTHADATRSSLAVASARWTSARVWRSISGHTQQCRTLRPPIQHMDYRSAYADGTDVPQAINPCRRSCDGRDGSTRVKSVEIFDPVTSAWTAGPPMSTGRTSHSQSTLADGRVLVCGGRDLNVASLDTAEIFDPITNVWTAVAPMRTKHQMHSQSTLVDGRVLVSGGYDGTRRRTVETCVI